MPSSSRRKSRLDTKEMLDKAGITEQRRPRGSRRTRRSTTPPSSPCAICKARGNQQQLLADFEDYLNGFSQNVQDILENFKFRNQLSTLSKSDALGTLIGKFLDPKSISVPLNSGIRQPLDNGHGVRGATPQVQRGKQRGSR
jgi:hypothetical protein